jgi:hypothetical protein
MYGCDSESTLEVILIDVLECFENYWDSSNTQMINGNETNFSNQLEEERYLVDKEDICCQEDIFVEVEYLLRDFNEICCWGNGLASDGLAFQCCEVFPQIFRSTSTFWTVTGQSFIWLLRMIYLRSFQDGKRSVV